MAVQLPEGAIGAAAGVLTYSFISLILSLLLLWVIQAHNERTSYVAMLSFFVSLNTLCSIIQQIHTLVSWDDVKTEQYNYQVANVGNPEITFAGGCRGMDLVLFYIQEYTFSVDAMIVMFWAWELTCSVYHLRMLKQIGPYWSLSVKCFAVLLPILQTGLLKSKAIQDSVVAFLVIANSVLSVAIVGGGSLLLAILYKYIATRRAFENWNVRYGKSGTGSKSDATSGNRSQPRAGPPPRSRGSIYDRWLVVRFSIAFSALMIFQAFTIFFQVNAQNSNTKSKLADAPDLSTGNAIKSSLLFIPGATQGVIIFIVFGTTRTFRNYVIRNLIPRRFWRKSQAAQRPTTGDEAGPPELDNRQLGRPSHSSTSHLGTCPDEPESERQSPTPTHYETHGIGFQGGVKTLPLPRKEAWESDVELTDVSKTHGTETRTYGW